MRQRRTDPIENSFTEAMETQLQIMRGLVEQLDRRGYCLHIGSRNNDARDNKYLYKYFSGSIKDFLRTWSEGRRRKRRYPIFITVHIEGDAERWMDGDFSFVVKIPDRHHFQIINLALEYVSREAGKGRNADRTILANDAGLLTRHKMSDTIQYRGRNKASLRLLLGVLEMPDHKAILLTGDSGA
jgi:hypothetical protein